MAHYDNERSTDTQQQESVERKRQAEDVIKLASAITAETSNYTAEELKYVAHLMRCSREVRQSIFTIQKLVK